MSLKPLPESKVDGAIDEVVIFDRVLTANEVQALHSSPWEDVALAATDKTLTTWSYTMNHALEGPYKIDLFGTDEVGNSGLSLEAWTGIIDTMAPRLTLSYVDNGDGTAQVACTAEDDFLRSEGWSCPATAESVLTENQQAAWWTTNITQTQLVKLYTNEVTVASVANPTITACDMVGNCLTTSSQDAADQVPTSLPVDEEPSGDAMTKLFLPIISNQPQTNEQVTDAASGQSGVMNLLVGAQEAGEGAIQIFLPIISNQVDEQAQPSQSVVSSGAQSTPAAEGITHRIMLPLVTNQ